MYVLLKFVLHCTHVLFVSFFRNVGLGVVSVGSRLGGIVSPFVLVS